MGQPQVIRTLITSALQLWLRSLVTQVARLEITIDASDRQLLGGRVPAVSLQAEEAIYQGLSLSRLSLQASEIRLNLGQVLRGKPLRLLEPVPAQLQAKVSAADLNDSLDSQLLAPALTAVTQRLLPAQRLRVRQIALAPGQVYLQGILEPNLSQNPAGDAHSRACLTARLVAQGAVLQAQEIILSAPDLNPAPQALPQQAFPLGDATLQQLDITAEAIAIAAQIKILP